MFNVVAFDEDSGEVKLAHRSQHLIPVWRQYIVEGSDSAVRSETGVRVFVIIEHLILVGDRTVALFGNQIFDAAVTARRDAPFKLKIEIVEMLYGNNVDAAGSAVLS